MHVVAAPVPVQMVVTAALQRDLAHAAV
jgi:hypothetical protein